MLSLLEVTILCRSVEKGFCDVIYLGIQIRLWVDRASVLRLHFLFFFLRFEPTRLDSRRRGSIRAEPARIGPYRPYQSISAGDRYSRYGRNRPETAEIGLKTRRSSRNSDLRCVFCLLLSLFYESSILMCFLRIF